MRSEGLSAAVAVVGGVLIAALAFVPVVAYRYRRTGRMSAGDLLAVVVVPVYGLALWTYTLLPLPDPATIVCRDAITQPFAFVEDIRASWTGASPADLLRNYAFLQVSLNVALFAPFGALLRWRRRTGLLVTMALGFATSLAIELTQLTGMWGVYECAYRYFEVDDLIANTTGAVVGWAAVALVVRHRPVARAAPTTVTAGRRLIGLAGDGLAMLLVGAVAILVWRSWLTEVRDVPILDIDLRVQSRVQWGTALAVQAVAVLVGGRTVGEWAVDLRPVPRGRWGWAVPRRVVRLVAGPGLLAVLAASDAPVTDVAVVVVVVIAVVAAIVVPGRGLGGLVSGTEMVPAIRHRRGGPGPGVAPPP